jgi:hypothetical protein
MTRDMIEPLPVVNYSPVDARWKPIPRPGTIPNPWKVKAAKTDPTPTDGPAEPADEDSES